MGAPEPGLCITMLPYLHYFVDYHPFLKIEMILMSVIPDILGVQYHLIPWMRKTT
jgi:hypothetical protein